jgi:hypothetical protein
VLFEVWVGGGEGGAGVDEVEALRAVGVAAAVRVEVPCSTTLVVTFAFVSAVFGVLLVVGIAVSAWSVVAGSETEAVRSVVAGVGCSPVPPCVP